MKFLALPLVAFTSATLLACSSDDPVAPTTLDAGTCAGNLDAFRFPHGGDGSADPFGAKAAGQARAGRIRDAAQIVQPDDARNKVRVGDFVLANDRVAVYIEAEGESDGYNPLGGEILALEPVGADGRPTAVSYYNETLIMFARQTVKPERVTVLADGADGKAAIVRVSGKLENVPFLDTFKAIFPDEYGFPAALDYVLEPGSTRVQLRLSLVNTTIDPVDFKNKQFLGFFHAARNDIFTESQGYAEAKGESPFVAFDSGKAGFLVRAVNSPLRAELEVSGFQLFSLQGLALDACATKTVDYAEMIAGAPGLDGVLETKRAALGEPAWREVRGVVKEEGGAPVPGAYVHATAADGRYLSRTNADAQGAFVLHVPAGDALLTPTSKGWAIPAATTVPAAAGTTDLTLPRPGLLEVVVTDATTSEPLPARVQVIPTAAIAAAPASFGLTDDEEVEGRLWQEFAVTGRALLKVPVGEHRVIVTRGYEYELFDAPATAEADKTTTVTVPLARSVDSPGVMCADFHIHSHFSADSNDLPELKVKGAIADGLEIPVSSEHEWILDFQPFVQKLNLTKWAFGLPGEELTTFTFGHFGVVPLVPRPDAVNNGAVAWIGKKPSDIFRAVNALPEKPVLIVNHPRSSGFGGYFSASSFDRAKVSGNDLWSDEFAAIEAFNDSDFEKNREGSVADWFALLNAGKTYWAVGASDSHHERTSPVGYPRSCMKFGHDDPTKLSAESVRDVLRSGNVVVSGGLTMSVEGPGGIGPGGTATKGAYKVTIASPSWLSASELEVIVDGVTTEKRALTSTGAGPGKRYEVTVDVAPVQSKARHWVVFHAKGGGDLAPLHPGRKPFAVSNPIFFGP